MKITDKLTYDGSRHILMAGNCVLENREIAFRTAEHLKQLAEEIDVDLIFKASYRKDNRSSEKFFAGLPLPDALEIFSAVKQEFDLPLVTDVHYPTDLDEGLADVFDVLQIPAYLAMQTRLVMDVAKTGLPINIKKAQFLHPEEMKKVCAKVEATGNNSIMLTERGTAFGYRDLVVDLRSFHIMKETGYPVLFDAGHSIRKYGLPSSDPKGGTKEFLPTMMNGCAATDLAGLFIEVHPEPAKALCDAASQLNFEESRKMITRYFEIAKFVRMMES